MPSPFKIFICYAREDHSPLEMLRKKLVPLESGERVQLWYDREITGGKVWDEEIRFNLQSADIVLLLISDDFFDSKYINKVEMKEALAGHARQENIVVPVILHDCVWDAHPELARLQALPAEAKPIFDENHWRSPSDGFNNVVRGILRILDDPDIEARRFRKIARLEALAADLAAEIQRVKAAAAKEVAEKRRLEQEAAAQRKREAEEAFKKVLPEMVFVKGGTFQMGEKGIAEPIHTVTLSDFEIGKYPVTTLQYLAFCDETGKNHPEWMEARSKYHIQTGSDGYYKKEGIGRAFENHPIVGISWYDAVAYCKWLSQKAGKNYRLPTEAEWEFAARGGTLSKGFRYAGSDNLEEVSWFLVKYHPVGQKKANELNLYDMSGNVWEWCNDWHDRYPSGAQNNPQGPKSGSHRVYRGGSAGGGEKPCLVSFRDKATPGGRYFFTSFRLASPPQ